MTLSDVQQDLNPDYPEKRFCIWIRTRKRNLFPRGRRQKPDGIIEYEVYGTVMYMWYYNDLQSNKRGDLLSYSVDVPK